MFIYAACLRRNFNYCSKLSLQLILFQDFIEKEWKDNGRDKCTGPEAPADIGRGKNCIFALDDVKTRERTPTRCIISDYMTTTMESSNNTYPDELDTSRWGSLLINLNNIQCARCKKCVSSLIY